MRKIIAATVSAALSLMSIAPAYAQANYSPAFDSPRGATATVNLRLGLGGAKKKTASYGVSLSYGHTMAAPTLEGRTLTRASTLADLRFDGSGLKRAQVASFDLANLDQDRRLNLTDGGDNTLLFVGLGVAAGVAAYFLFIDDNDDDEDSE
jgi:hypothetical protein